MKQPLFLQRTRLLPGESLPSLLERLTRLNHYPNSGIIDWICHERTDRASKAYKATRPSSIQTFLFLSQLSGISPDTLFAASDHRFAPALTAPGQTKVFMPWMDGESKQIVTKSILSRRLCSVFSTQFCPLCLAESAYHRLSWTPVAATICLQHQCLLLERCPGCGKEVSMQEVVDKYCRTCEADLSRGSTISVVGDELGILSQQVIQHWLSVAPAPTLPLGRTLPNHPPNILYHFLDKLRQILIECQDDWSNLPEPLADLSKQIPERSDATKRMSPRDAYYLYRAAFRGILDWPQGLDAFLHAYSQRNPKSQASSRLNIRLGTFWRWSQRDWLDPEFEFVQQGLVHHLMSRDIPFPQSMLQCYKDVSWFIEQTDLWTQERTMQTLGISIQVLRRFLPDGPLGQCLWLGGTPRQPMFKRETVLSVKRQWETGLPLKHACYWLGLLESQVVELVQLGSLTVECGLDSPDYADWVLHWQSVEAFFEAVAGQLTQYQGLPHEIASLNQIVYWTSHAGIDGATLLKSVADGILTGYKREPTIHSLANVCFLEAKPFALAETIYAQRGWISTCTFAQKTGIDTQVVEEWVSAGLIEPVAKFVYDKLFERQEIEQLAAEHLSKG